MSNYFTPKYERVKAQRSKVSMITAEKKRIKLIKRAMKGKKRKKRPRGRPKTTIIPNQIGARARNEGNVYVVSAKRGPYKRTENRAKGVRGTFKPTEPYPHWTGWEPRKTRRRDNELPRAIDRDQNKRIRDLENTIRAQTLLEATRQQSDASLKAEIERLKANQLRNFGRLNRLQGAPDPRDTLRRAPSATRDVRFFGSDDDDDDDGSSRGGGRSKSRPASSVFTKLSEPPRRERTPDREDVASRLTPGQSGRQRSKTPQSVIDAGGSEGDVGFFREEKDPEFGGETGGKEVRFFEGRGRSKAWKEAGRLNKVNKAKRGQRLFSVEEREGGFAVVPTEAFLSRDLNRNNDTQPVVNLGGDGEAQGGVFSDAQRSVRGLIAKFSGGNDGTPLANDLNPEPQGVPLATELASIDTAREDDGALE